MFFLGETKNCSKSFPKTSIDASTDAKVSCLGWTVVASQGHQKLLSSLFLTETSFLSSRTTTHPSIFRRTREHRLGLTSVLLDVPHRSISEFAIVKPGHRLGSRCFAELSSVAVAPAFLPRNRATHEPAQQPGGEGWLVNPEQQKVVQFKPDAATVHAQWVARWIPPNPPVPQARRRMLRHNAIEPGTRCSKQAGGAVHHPCADGIKNTWFGLSPFRSTPKLWLGCKTGSMSAMAP